MPKIVIWIPRDEKHPGHVAIATNEYYVSFWPANCLEMDGKKIRVISDAADFVLKGRKGCLVFHKDVDKEYEEERDPIEHPIDTAKVSNEDLNAEIEAFLRYNEIDPEDVTLAKGEEKYQEYRQLAASLPPEEAKRIKDDQKPVKSLAETKYSIVTELVSRKKDDDSAPFYNSHQSCVSFAFNLVQMAWLKSHPDPIPIVNYEEAKSSSEFSMTGCLVTVGANSLLTDKIPKEFAYKVPWFEKEVVRRYLITGSKVNNQPKISVKPGIEKIVRQLKPAWFSTFVLLLLGYFFPDTAYPNVLIYWNYVSEGYEVIDDPSLLDHFIVPLFIILLAHHNWCGVVLSVVIYCVGKILYYMNGGSQIRFWVEFLSVVGRIAEEVDEHARVVLGRKPKSRVERFRIYIDFLRRAHTK